MLSQSVPPYWSQALAYLFEKPWRIALTLGILDLLGALVGLLGGFLFSYYILLIDEPIIYYIPVWIGYTIFLIFSISLNNGYLSFADRRPDEELNVVIMGNIYAFILITVSNYIFSKELILSRYILLIGFLYSLVLIILLRFNLRHLLSKLWSYGLARANILVIGNSVAEINGLLDHLQIQRYNGINIIGYVAKTASNRINKRLRYLGDNLAISPISRVHHINKVFIALRGYNAECHNEILAILKECAKLQITAMIVSHIFNDYHFSLTLEGYSSIYAIDKLKAAHTTISYRVMKRAMDILIAATILFLSLPLWLIVAISIKIDDRGPILYRAPRVGKQGKIFNVIKFRTMVTNASEILQRNSELLESFNKNIKLINDPRVTRVGKYLRRASIDELPQCINILKGEMSLVGPRPISIEEIDLFGDFIKERNEIRPGLTGFWQISGRSLTSYDERIQMDKFYIYKGSIWMDLTILLETPIKIIRGEGAM